MAGDETIHRGGDVIPLRAGITLHRRSPTPRRRHVAPRSHRTFTRRPPVCSRADDVTSFPWKAVPLNLASAALAEQTGTLLGEVASRADHSPTLRFHAGGSCRRKHPAALHTLQRVQRFMDTNAEA
jgi:hypothetical protein